METIWEFELEVTDDQLIDIPAGAVTLDVQTRYGIPCLWARVDPEEERVKRRILTHGTGHPVPSTTGDHIGSYQMQDGALVFHVFEAA